MVDVERAEGVAHVPGGHGEAISEESQETLTFVEIHKHFSVGVDVIPRQFLEKDRTKRKN